MAEQQEEEEEENKLLRPREQKLAVKKSRNMYLKYRISAIIRRPRI